MIVKEVIKIEQGPSFQPKGILITIMVTSNERLLTTKQH